MADADGMIVLAGYRLLETVPAGQKVNFMPIKECL